MSRRWSPNLPRNLPRNLHPGAWWLWAIGLAIAASRTTNPVLLAMLFAVVCTVVAARRGDAPWANAFRLYLWLAAIIVGLRVAFRVLFGGATGSTVLVDLPTLGLAGWANGLHLLGPVTAEALLGGLYDGLRLATMVVCIGAANALANPKRLLKAMPAALYETGSVVVVSMSVFPQLAESTVRIRAARRLRGDSRVGLRGRLGAVRSVAVPVLEDALERSLRLAAAMDSRGYGRSGVATPRERRVTAVLTVIGLLGVCVGVYATLDYSAPRYLAAPLLGAGVLLAAVGFVLTGQRVGCTRYRPDHWHLAELVTAASGLAGGALMWAGSRIDPLDLHPSLSPLSWPQLSLLTVVAVLVGLLPAVVTPRPATVTGPADRTADAERMEPGRRVPQEVR